MKKSIYTIILFSILLVVLESCVPIIIGHLKVHNPRHEGKTPNFTDETILLGELTKYRSCFDVHYYDLSLDIKPNNKSIGGSVEIHAKALENFDTIQIDLDDNFEITQLTEAGNDTPLKFIRQERAVFVKLNKNKNENFVLKISYNGKPIIAKLPPWKGGFVWKKDHKGNHWDGVACESAGASIWWPLKDHTSDEPDSMRLHYTVPKGLMAIGNGQFEGQINTKEKTTYNWFISYPINTYNVSFYVGKFQKIEEQYIGINGKSLQITHYVLEKNYEKAKLHFKQVHDQLAFYEKRFGEYPWYNDGFKLIESPYRGMEHQTAIAYGNGYKNIRRTETDHIILHEMAHEWWGNSISAKDLAHVWLQEGFATYSEALYFEEKNGVKAYQKWLDRFRIIIQNKYPLVVKEGRRWFHFRQNIDVYFKGAWILHSLRTQINNDKVFFDIIKTFAERNKYKIIESKDFVEVVNEKTNSDYNWFFNHYLYYNEAPSLSYTISKDGVLYYKWSNTDSSFDKLKIKLKIKNQVITPSSNIQAVLLPKPQKQGWRDLFLDDVLFAFKKDNSLISEYNSQY